MPAPIYTCCDVSDDIYRDIHTYIYLGAGKHPSPLDISKSYSPDLYLKVGFYLIKKYCSCPKLSQFKDRALLWLVPAPIHTCCDVSDDIHIWVLASTRALLTYQNLILSSLSKSRFYLIKKYCSCPKLSQFKDRALLWLVPAPIWVLASTWALLTYQNLILLIFI